MPESGAFVAVLSRQNPNEPLIVAARALASAGIPVFPCVPRGKRPMTEHGFRDATTSLDQVSAWWREQPAANIGMPTGWVSGVVVVDVDVHGPVNGFKAYNRAARAGLVSGWQVLVETPSGGMHAYFPTADAEQRCWQSATSGIDFRGRRLRGRTSVDRRRRRYAQDLSGAGDRHQGQQPGRLGASAGVPRSSTRSYPGTARAIARGRPS